MNNLGTIMTPHPKLDPGPLNPEEERLAHALISRGMVTREEVQRCRAFRAAGTGPEALLSRLADAGFLTPNQAQRAAQEMRLLLTQPIPGYELLEKVGQGTMGMVYKARQLSMNRLVAVKTLSPRLADNPRYLERFVQEAHLAAKLSHNNIVQAIDVGSTSDINYFVMEYVQGTTIKEHLEGGKIYGEPEALQIILQIARALEHANHRQLIHRDVKPSNIILTPEGTAKLADLGLARETADHVQARSEKGLVFGTPFYISPEQIQGKENIDIRADIYALGATLYHMVTGQTPYHGKTIEEVLKAHLREELKPPDHLNTTLSAGLGEVVEVMMAKKRSQRYQTPADLILDLECLLRGEPPKLARKRIEETVLGKLAEGETERKQKPKMLALTPTNYVWLVILGGLLALSGILNLWLWLRGWNW